MVWKDLVKHSPLYNTHRKDQKTPEPHPASPPLLQGRAPAAIAETSFLLQHSLHVNYRKILYSFNIKFQLAAGSSNLPANKRLITNIRNMMNKSIQREESPWRCCNMSCCAISAGNVESSYQEMPQSTHFKITWGYLRMFPFNSTWQQWDGHICKRYRKKHMANTESKKALHLHHRIAIITEVQILPISFNFRCLTKCIEISWKDLVKHSPISPLCSTHKEKQKSILQALLCCRGWLLLQ